MKIKLALEWFLNPDHLPFLVAKDKNIFKDLNIELEIIEPDDHYDGFTELTNGNIEFATNEPLHLIEKYHSNIISLGNFFETNGGIIFSENGYKKLLDDQLVKISSPVSNNVTDTIALDIIKKHLESVSVKRQKKTDIIVKDFYHIKNIKNGLDAAWLCFENFEGVESRLEGLKVKKIYLENVNIPNFCALDLFTSKSFFENNKNLCKDFKKGTEEAIKIIINDLDYALYVYYSKTKQEKTELMNSIIEDTYKRFLTPFHNSLEKWKSLYDYTIKNKISDISQTEYSSMFANI